MRNHSISTFFHSLLEDSNDGEQRVCSGDGFAGVYVNEKEKTAEPVRKWLNVVFTLNNLNQHQKLGGENTRSPAKRSHNPLTHNYKSTLRGPGLHFGLIPVGYTLQNAFLHFSLHTGAQVTVKDASHTVCPFLFCLAR